MKTGYSNLLGEHIDAMSIDYGDCQSFQIVCPNCREPVFKVNRKGQAIHYLSHYEAANAYDAECELRVAAMTLAQMHASDHVSREQRLKFFLSVLQQAISKHEYSGHGRDRLAGAMRHMLSGKAVTQLRDLCFEHAKGSASLSESSFDLYADTYINDDVGVSHEMWRTGFAMATQKRIAKDVFLSLCTAPARPNFNFLWNHGFLMLLERLRLARKQGTSPAPFVAMERHLARLTECGRNEGERIVAKMLHTPMFPPHVEEPGFPMLLKALAEIMHEQIGCLLRLPYFDLLKERGNG